MSLSIGNRINFRGVLGTQTVLNIDHENKTIETEFGVESFDDFYARDPILAKDKTRPVPGPEIGGTRDG
jgi:hypothetical protein